MSEHHAHGAAEASLDPDTRWQVSEVLSRYDHIVDNQEWSYLPLVFIAGARLDAQGTAANGVAEIQGFLESLGPWISHHTVNTLTKRSGPDSEVIAWSRFLVVEAGGASISGDYLDTLTATANGWRIRSRRVAPRNRAETELSAGRLPDVSFAAWNAA